jgi:(p)ppGpp synthase/HD superfamily hydrolase
MAVLESRILLIYSGRVRRAMQLAEHVHRGQGRASGDYPYFLHLVAVASILIAAGADDELIIAALLHDSVEDTDLTITEVEDEFGSGVARLVAAVTKQRVPGMRKEEIHRLTEEYMRSADGEEAALKAADLLANISDLILDQRELGYKHWTQVFKNRERADFKITHYLDLADILLSRLQHHQVFPILSSHLRTRADELRHLFEAWV